jgi:arginine/serine-rich splicing factor 7
MPRSRSRSPSQSRSRSATPSLKRSRSPLSDHDSGNDRSPEHRIHVAELPQGIQEAEIRKTFQRYGPVLDVFVASASCFAFVVYKHKEDAQKAIDQMDGRYDFIYTYKEKKSRQLLLD